MLALYDGGKGIFTTHSRFTTFNNSATLPAIRAHARTLQDCLRNRMKGPACQKARRLAHKSEALSSEITIASFQIYAPVRYVPKRVPMVDSRVVSSSISKGYARVWSGSFIMQYRLTAMIPTRLKILYPGTTGGCSGRSDVYYRIDHPAPLEPASRR